MKCLITTMFLLIFSCHLLMAQDNTDIDTSGITYYGKDYYEIGGTSYSIESKEHPFDRIPLNYKNNLREVVWDLSKNSSGIHINFETNSAKINVKWSVLDFNSMPHMTDIGIKGLDLYCEIDGQWQFVASAKADDYTTEKTIIENLSNKWKKFRIYLPLYDCTTSFEIGIASDSEIRPAKLFETKPIVFYGTSITQGACASRPGMSYTSIISRKLNVDCYNFGFSGNGKLESEVAELIGQIDASLFVIDCLPNVNPELVIERTKSLVDIIRKYKPVIPIVLVEGQYRAIDVLVLSKKILTEKRNNAFRAEFEKLQKLGYKNIYYISHQNLTGKNKEATVDGSHYTDLGFWLFSENLIENLTKFKIIKNIGNW